MALDLSRMKLVRETPEAWHVHDGETEFPVAKHGLSKEMHEAISQHFADGGDVQSTAVNTDPATQTQADVDADNAAIDAAQASGQSVPGVNEAPTPTPPLTLDRLAGSMMGAPEDASAPPPATDSHDKAAVEAAAKAAASLPAVAPPVAPLTLAPPPAQLPPGGTGGFDAAVADQQKQIAAMGKINSDLAQQQAQNFQTAAAQHQQNLDATKQMFTQLQSNGRALTDAVLAKKIDPEHFWNSRTTGQRVMATIGMALGGLSSGMGGGPNYAAQIINSAIDRDVNAQKANIDNMNTGVSHYVQQGHDILSASQLWGADLKDITAARVEQTAQASGAQNAIPAAKALADSLREQAISQRLGVAAQTYAVKRDQITLAQQQKDVALQDLQREAQKRLWTGNATPNDIQRLVPGNTLVNTPGGGMAPALDPDAAKKVRESQVDAGSLQNKLERYQKLLASGRPATPTLIGGDKGTATSLYNGILAELGSLHEQKRLSDQDVKIYSAQLPDITDLYKPEAAQKIGELINEINTKMIATNRANLRQ